MKLIPYDAYSSLRRFLPGDAPLTIVDVGANEGQMVRRMLGEFPLSTVHAFEPAPQTFELLRKAVSSDDRVHLHQKACGSSDGQIDFHVTNNHWCSSVLRPSELGKRFYGDWYETQQVVKVPVVRLDTWARQQAIERVDIFKIDAQGYDLEVLRGAGDLVKAAVAINCECQFAPEYEGCASFSEIDLYLRSQGFALHQLHEVFDRGAEQQTAYGDGLWLRQDVLASLRQRKDLPDRTPVGRVSAALREAAKRGCMRAALYGSGRHTKQVAAELLALPLPVVAIIDDDPRMHGQRIEGVEITSLDEALARAVDVIVLSSDAHEPLLWKRCEQAIERGVRVIPLYHAALMQRADAAFGYLRTGVC